MIPVRLRLSAIDLDVLNPSKFPPVQWLRCSRFFGARRPERARRAPLPPNEKGPTRGLFHWRTGWDSNPRYACTYAAFRVRCLQPLDHLSAGGDMGTGSGWQVAWRAGLSPLPCPERAAA